ncbi:MAG: Na/Pi cotransporter family protein, partial [Ruminococcus sp.]|nr:Na/Pi cotransporter family protein [Ruminococcus sp.]
MGFGNIATLLSGLGLLLYGIKILGEGLELAAGAKLKVLLEKMTSNRFAAVLVGFVITTLIQSSSTTTVMVVGFVNTGIMNLTQAIGVIMGANIGTTTTSILVSLDIGKYAPIAIGIGVFLSMLTKKTTKKHIGLAITGFGMLFLGMTLMKDAMEPLASSPVFSEWLMNANNPFVAILIGTVITAVIQSSAASIGILQALASQGLIPLHFAAYVIYGQNIGTCITALISSIGTKKNSKRTAVMHVLFNVFGTVIFIILTKLLPFTDWIESLTDNTMMQLSLVHIIFNVVSTLIMFPFADKVLVKLACLIVPDKKDSSEDDFKLQFVDNLMINTPPFAVAQVSKEVHRMAGLARQNFSIAAEDLLNKSCDHFDEVQHTEEVINFLNHNITPIL